MQEGLTNALKHGAERRAHVLLETDAASLRVVVTNPTSPLTPVDEVPSGHGIVGLRERVATVRGTLEAGTAPGGFRLAATLPIPPAPEPEATEEEGATP